MERITFTPITLRFQKPTEVKECFIELYENVLRYKIEFQADEWKDENDEQMGEESVYNYFDIYAFKKSVSGIEMSFTKDKKWGIFIRLNGFASDIRLYCRTKTTAQEIFDKINLWLFNNPVT